MSKDDIISKVYFDPAGYGSINETLKDAKQYDNIITYGDVKNWKQKHTEMKTNEDKIHLQHIMRLRSTRWITCFLLT